MRNHNLTRLIDWLTIHFEWVYRWRKAWCERRHQWVERRNGQWDRTECRDCGFWEEFG